MALDDRCFLPLLEKSQFLKLDKLFLEITSTNYHQEPVTKSYSDNIELHDLTITYF